MNNTVTYDVKYWVLRSSEVEIELTDEDIEFIMDTCEDSEEFNKKHADLFDDLSFLEKIKDKMSEGRNDICRTILKKFSINFTRYCCEEANSNYCPECGRKLK